MELIEDKSRFVHPKMAYYNFVYQNSPCWDGHQSLAGKTVIVYGEQGYGDIIQFARYVPNLMRQCYVIFHCPTALHRLFESSQIGHEWLDRNNSTLPKHDFHIPSMSLPFLGLKEASNPYLQISDGRTDIDGELKVGIAWEGNPEHSNNFLRSCRLSLFNKIQQFSHVKLYMLQQKVNLPQLADVDENFQIFSIEKKDFYDTATLVMAMDIVISVDTSVLHLAGALGKKNVYGLLSSPCDARWEVKEWYPTLNLIHDQDGNWRNTFQILEKTIKDKKTSIKVHKTVRRSKDYDSILITGGIGDFIALESHMDATLKQKIKQIYLATRADDAIEKLCHKVFKSNVVKIISDYKSMTFYQKSEVSSYLKSIDCPFPSNWKFVEDWSILVKFDEINQGLYPYCGTEIFNHVEGIDQWQNYVVVCPMTNTERDTGRDFNQKDWQQIVKYLENTNRLGIVIAGEKVDCTKHENIINLTGQTSLLESIGILKNASGYLGIDSFLSILAAQRFNPPDLIVKSVNPHLYNYSNIYYPFHNERNYIRYMI